MTNNKALKFFINLIPIKSYRKKLREKYFPEEPQDSLLTKLLETNDYGKIYNEVDSYYKQIINKYKLKSFEKSALLAVREVIVISLYFKKKSGGKIRFKEMFEYASETQLELTDYSDVVFFGIDDRLDQREIIKSLGYKITKPIVKSSNHSNIINGLKVLFYTYKSIFLMRKLIYFKEFRYNICQHLLKFYTYYFSLDLKNIKVILSECTAYYEYPAIVAKAETCGVDTIKVEYFITNASTVDTTRINAKYDYPLDSVHKEFYKQFFYNKDVQYIGVGGRLSSDFLYEYKYKTKPINNPKQILYISSHGLFAPLDKLYIEKLKEFANKYNMELTVKLHPNDKRNPQDWLPDGVKISKLADREMFKLIYESDFVFSIFSSLLYQAKLINQNCFALDIYDAPEMDILGIREGQKAYSEYLEVVNSEEMLDKFITGEAQTTTTEYYIKEINPNFGSVAQSLKDFINDRLDYHKKVKDKVGSLDWLFSLNINKTEV